MRKPKAGEGLSHVHRGGQWEILVLEFKSKCGYSMNHIKMLPEFVKDEALWWMLLALKQGRTLGTCFYLSLPFYGSDKTKMQDALVHDGLQL